MNNTIGAFTAVDGLFPRELIDDARREMDGTPPGRLGRGLMLPSLQTLDSISTHPRLRAAARQLLGTDRLTLTQSEAWSKSPTTFGHGAYDNRDQRVRRARPPQRRASREPHSRLLGRRRCTWIIPTTT